MKAAAVGQRMGPVFRLGRLNGGDTQPISINPDSSGQ